MATSKAQLQARGISRRASDTGQCLLQPLDISVGAGDRFAIVGASGSGKTLLLRTLALLDPPASGEVLWRGEPARGHVVPEFRASVMYLHQQPSLIESSVEGNLQQAFAFKTHRRKQYSRDRALHLLAILERDESFLARQQRDLSGGELQITAILRAILLEPTILLLDEPTAALDSESTEAIEGIIDQWQDERIDQRAFVWVTHSHEQALRVAQRRYRMEQGRLTNAE